VDFLFLFLTFCFSSAVLWQCLMHAASHIFQSRSLARSLALSGCLLQAAKPHFAIFRSLSLSLWRRRQEARQMKERSSG
jgi:hypothetical protein